MQELLPSIVEIKFNSGINTFDAVAVAAQSDGTGEAASVALIASALARVAAACPVGWAQYRLALVDAADTMRERAAAIQENQP